TADVSADPASAADRGSPFRNRVPRGGRRGVLLHVRVTALHQDRRQFLRTSIGAFVATRLGMTESHSAFDAIRQIDAGLLNVGYAEWRWCRAQSAAGGPTG